MEQWGTTFGENLSVLPKVQEFPYKCRMFFMKLLQTVRTLLAQLAKRSFLIYTEMCSVQMLHFSLYRFFRGVYI